MNTGKYIFAQLIEFYETETEVRIAASAAESDVGKNVNCVELAGRIGIPVDAAHCKNHNSHSIGVC